jgi:lambda family phage tail tape measure protein
VADFRIRVIVDPAQAVRGVTQVEARLSGLENRANRLRGTLGTALRFAGLTFVLRELAQLGDEFTSLQNKIRFVTESQQELTTVTRELFQISQDTRASFSNTAQLFTRVAVSSRELGVSYQDLLGFTKSLNQAIILSGASTKEAGAALIQLSQGLASGALRGDELRSVLEQLPAVADVIAKRMKVTRGALRALGQQGRITSDVIIKGFQDASKELEEKFARTVPTLSQSFEVLRNSALNFVGVSDQAGGVMAKLSRSVIFLAENIETVSRIILTVLVAKAFAALLSGLSAIRVALLTNPFGLFLGAIGLAAGAVAGFGDKIVVLSDGVTTLQDVVVSAFDNIVEAIKNGDFSIAGVTAAVSGILIGLVALATPLRLAAAGVLKLGGALTALGTILIRNPFLIMAATAVAAAVGVVSLIKRIEELNKRTGQAVADGEKYQEFASRIRNATAEIERLDRLIAVAPGNQAAQRQLDAAVARQQALLADLDKFRGEAEQRFKERDVARSAASEIAAGIEESGFAGIIDKIFGDAADRAAERAKAAAESAKSADLSGRFGDPADPVALSARLIQLEEETILLAKVAIASSNYAEALREEHKIGISLSASQRERLTTAVLIREHLELQAKILMDLNREEDTRIKTTAALNALLDAGAISNEEYARKLADVQLAAARASHTLEGGFQAGLIRVAQTIDDVGSLMENTLVNAFTAAEDALVNFVRTGKFEFEEFANALLDDIARLLVRLLILQAIQAATGTGGATQALTGVAQRAGGGPIEANRPYLVGEEGPELIFPDRAGMVLSAQDTASALGQAAPPQVIQAPAPQVNVSVVNSIDPRMSVDAMDSPAGHQVIMNAIAANPKKVQRMLA